MTPKSPLLLIGVGGAGASIAYSVNRAFGSSMNHLLCDTDATSSRDSSPFILLGGDRLSGHGSGGDPQKAKLAAEESLHLFTEHLKGVRLAVIVTALGGGTGGGATVEILKHLRENGIPAIVFATLPFRFEGDERAKRATASAASIEETSAATVFTALDDLAGAEDNMDNAMRQAKDSLAAGISLFWRLMLKPGYIRLDAENLRKIIANAGRGYFATATARGEARTNDVLDSLKTAVASKNPGSRIKSVLLGILAGEDLRLSEVGQIADSLCREFGAEASFNLATVNDEETFSGRLAAVLLIFEQSHTGDFSATGHPKRRKRELNPLSQGPKGRGRFSNIAPTYINNEDIDSPTYLRKGIQLDI